ncbi:unnamed protein product, partial [Ixodes hexagonus]
SVLNKIAFPVILAERSSTDKIILKVHDDLVLALERTSVFSDTFQFIMHENSKIAYHASTIPASDIEQNLYHDIEKEAAVMITDNDGLRVEGTLGDTLRIRPSSVGGRNTDGQVAHEIFQIRPRHPGALGITPPGNSHSKINFKIKNSIGRSMSKSQFCLALFCSFFKLGILLTVSPELHVVVDKAHCTHFTLREQLLEYVAILIAAVNLKYRTLLYVDLQLVVTKVTTYTVSTIAVHFTPLECKLAVRDRNLTRPPQKIGDCEVVRTMWIYHVINPNSARGILETQLLCKVLQISLFRLAHVGGACQTWRRAALVEDSAKTFDGIHTFTHECGHL